MEIGLISCTKSKKDGKSQPKELYMESQLFRKKRKYAEKHHDKWYILSAKHGLLDPEGPPIEPYEDTLSGAKIGRKREWSKKVFKEMKKKDILDDELVFHAGKDYYSCIVPLLDEEDVAYRIPTSGLGIGEKLAWYTDH